MYHLLYSVEVSSRPPLIRPTVEFKPTAFVQNLMQYIRRSNSNLKEIYRYVVSIGDTVP
jgi:hypothetical protein